MRNVWIVNATCNHLTHLGELLLLTQEGLLHTGCNYVWEGLLINYSSTTY